MTNHEIQLLQFFICRHFKTRGEDTYLAEGICSNLFVEKFPYHLQNLQAVTCWRKDRRFHKEVLEYVVEDGPSYKTPPMDIEPLKGSVLFRWHRHPFPAHFVMPKAGLLTIRVILDWKVWFETHLLVEKRP